MIELASCASWRVNPYNTAQHRLSILKFDAVATEAGQWELSYDGSVIDYGITAARDLDSAKARVETLIRRMHAEAEAVANG